MNMPDSTASAVANDPPTSQVLYIDLEGVVSRFTSHLEMMRYAAARSVEHHAKVVAISNNCLAEVS